MLRACASVLVFTLLASPLLACPYCESDVGKEVAAGIFNDDFAHNALLTLLPVPLLLFIVALIHFGFPWPRRRSQQPRTNIADATQDAMP